MFFLPPTARAAKANWAPSMPRTASFHANTGTRDDAGRTRQEGKRGNIGQEAEMEPPQQQQQNEEEEEEWAVLAFGDWEAVNAGPCWWDVTYLTTLCQTAAEVRSCVCVCVCLRMCVVFSPIALRCCCWLTLTRAFAFVTTIIIAPSHRHCHHVCMVSAAPAPAAAARQLCRHTAQARCASPG